MFRKAGGCLVATFLVAACSEGLGPSNALEQNITEDLAMVAADAAVEDAQQMILTLGSPALRLLTGPRVEISRFVTFFDVQGVEQNQFDPITTASINIMTEVNGEVVRDDWEGTVSRSRDLTVSGLEGAETTRIWNGTGSGSVQRSRHTDADGARNYEMNSVSTVEDVTVGVPRSENPFPLSGTITRSITATLTNGDATEIRSRTAVLEFNGTQFATLTVGDEVFEVDLAARDGRRPHRRRRR